MNNEMNCHPKKINLKEWGNTNLWFDHDSYAGFIYTKINNKFVLAGRAGSSVMGHKAYDDMMKREKK